MGPREQYKIVDYSPDMATSLWAVFYSAVHDGCADYYSEHELNVWAPADVDVDAWQRRMDKIKPFVAIHDDTPVGFADLQRDGYIDHFYVHGHYMGKGVGRALLNFVLEKAKDKPRVYSNVSKAALPFFKTNDFTVVEEQRVDMWNAALVNYIVERLQ